MAQKNYSKSFEASFRNEFLIFEGHFKIYLLQIKRWGHEEKLQIRKQDVRCTPLEQSEEKFCPERSLPKSQERKRRSRRVNLEKDFAREEKVQKRVDRNRIALGERRAKLVYVKRVSEKDLFTKVPNAKEIINQIWVGNIQTVL